MQFKKQNMLAVIFSAHQRLQWLLCLHFHKTCNSTFTLHVYQANWLLYFVSKFVNVTPLDIFKANARLLLAGCSTTGSLREVYGKSSHLQLCVVTKLCVFRDTRTRRTGSYLELKLKKCFPCLNQVVFELKPTVLWQRISYFALS